VKPQTVGFDRGLCQLVTIRTVSLNIVVRGPSGEEARDGVWLVRFRVCEQV
jgi:hypothetical protein